MPEDEKVRPRYEPVEMEVGGTTGRTHAEVLQQTVGYERMLRSMTAGGPPTAPHDLERPHSRKDEMER